MYNIKDETQAIMLVYGGESLHFYLRIKDDAEWERKFRIFISFNWNESLFS